VTKPSRDASGRCLAIFLAALVAVLITLFEAGTASAAAAQIRAGAHSVEAQVVVKSHGGVGAGRRLGSSPSTYDSGLATGAGVEDLVAAAPRPAVKRSSYDDGEPSYDAPVRCPDARTVARVDAAGPNVTTVPLRRQAGAASEESVSVSGSLLPQTGEGSTTGRSTISDDRQGSLLA